MQNNPLFPGAMEREAHEDQSQSQIDHNKRCAFKERLGKYRREPEVLPQIFQEIGDGDPLGHVIKKRGQRGDGIIDSA